MTISQYEIYEFDISKAIKGDEMPENIIHGVIMSPDVMNKVLKTVIVAPLSNCCALTPTTFLIDENIRIRLDQISSISKKRITKFIGKIDKSQIPKIKDTLNEMLIK